MSRQHHTLLKKLCKGDAVQVSATQEEGLVHEVDPFNSTVTIMINDVLRIMNVRDIEKPSGKLSS